jgi:hypothetical protein
MILASGLDISESEFQEKWKSNFGAGTKIPKLSDSKVAMKMLTRLSDQDFANLLNTGELPAIELTPAEMEALKGGLTPIAAGLCIVAGLCWMGQTIAAHYGY